MAPEEVRFGKQEICYINLKGLKENKNCIQRETANNRQDRVGGHKKYQSPKLIHKAMQNLPCTIPEVKQLKMYVYDIPQQMCDGITLHKTQGEGRNNVGSG